MRRADEAAGLPALLVTSFLPGVRGDLLLPGLDPAGRATLGARLGDLLADLGGMPQLDGGPLRRRRPHGRQLLARRRRGRRAAGVRRPAGAAARLVDARRAGRAAGGGGGRPDPASTPWTGSAWCTATSTPRTCWSTRTRSRSPGCSTGSSPTPGHPFTDLGNLLRFEREAAFSAAVLARYAERRGAAPDEALALARAADLWALVELASRRGSNPVADAADRLLRERGPAPAIRPPVPSGP